MEDQQITGLFSFLLSIDWTERWLQGVMAFHVFCFAFSILIIYYNLFRLQASIFIIYLGLILSSEYINDYGSRNYRYFSKEQYFDSNGLFISIVFSTPLLLNSIVFVVIWMIKTSNMMIDVKRKELLIKNKHSSQNNDTTGNENNDTTGTENNVATENEDKKMK